MIESFKGADGQFSSKKIQMFASFTLAALLAIDSHFSGRALDKTVFFAFLTMAGYLPALSMTDRIFKKNGNSSGIKSNE